MPNDQNDDKKSGLLAKAAAKGAQPDGYIETYFKDVPAGDVSGLGVAGLSAIALSHLKLAKKRPRKTARVHAHTPTSRTGGWKTARTIVEVVTDDMPFLVDSVMSEINRQGLTVHLVIHPIFYVRRDKTGTIQSFSGKDDETAGAESFMHLQIGQIADPEVVRKLENGIETVLSDVRAAVEDWRNMREKMLATISDLVKAPQSVPLDDIDEACAFLQWMHDEQFTFLGYREYVYESKGKSLRTRIIPDTGLGVLRKADIAVLEELHQIDTMPDAVRKAVQHGDILTVTKTSQVSSVHRPSHMDSVGIKVYGEDGSIIGERVFVGLFTSNAYNLSPRNIPLLRLKVERVIERAGFAPSSHSAKAFLNILETYPRDELFQTSESDLYRIGLGILNLQERQRTALFMRTDEFERFVSCLIYMPRDDYTTDLRLRIQTIMEDALQGKVTAHYAQLGDMALARLHIIVKTTPGQIPPHNHDALEQHITEEARSWSARLSDVLIAEYGEHKGLAILRRYARAFPAGYREQFDAAAALGDIEIIEESLQEKTLSLNPYRVPGMGASRVRFKLYHPETALPLSDVLPVLEHLGLRVLDEIPHRVVVSSQGGEHHLENKGKKGKEKGGKTLSCPVMIHDFGVETRSGAAINLTAIAEIFREAFLQVWQGRADSDGMNGLILNGGLTVRQISMLRAYAKYLRQTGIAYSQSYMEQTLINNASLARLLADLFDARFNPEAKTTDRKKRAQATGRIEKAILDGLDAVTNADEDRIIRRFMNLILSTLRTNYYQKSDEGAAKDYISLKLDSQAIEELPLPRPLREIFVSSPRVEGVHLRFGLVARGGLRWSDRMEDFRTEILGLVKAQQVKNAVIVPVGSKGGFVVKNPPTEGGRDAFLAEGIECYKIFIRALLDVTDNLSATGKVLPPKNVVRWDEDDPYLVVAADKGTATFSDIANGVSADYGFWLGDAFASGGSQGYDHKKMGITARGGWESVKRHFREIGTNIQKEDFSVVGVGDMAGDVFGNGMLLSKHIRLLGAFNHMHIFVDPNPDPAASYRERQRLFRKARSTWADYDKKVLSKGACIFERSAKSLKLTPEIKACFGITTDTITPNEMIRTLLKADVDLMWFGGIGTYIKASNQSTVDAGDRTNDAIRIDATEVRAKVIGEGANLGLTQQGRIEYALAGGRLNTDSIDNSAGVDCSDHEVNIKILLDQVVREKKLTGPQRNALLAEMTDEVGALVLRDNYLQTQAITSVQALGVHLADHQMRLMRLLEKRGRLDRRVENLPDDETLAERMVQGKGLTRPEIAVVISYSKIWAYDEILASSLPDDPVLADDLVTYFPEPLQKKYAKSIGQHRLKREIVATRVTNSLVNRVGGTFISQHMEKTGMKAADIARAYVVAAKVFDMRGLWREIEGLDNKVTAQVQTAMLLDINKLLDRAVAWLLRNGKHPLSIQKMIDEFGAGVVAMRKNVKKSLPKRYGDDIAARAVPYVEAGVPKALAHEVTGLINFAPAFDIVRLAEKTPLDVAGVAALYFNMGTRFRLGHLRAACEKLETESHWQKLAIAALVEEIFAHQRALTASALKGAAKGASAERILADWIAEHAAAVDRADQMLTELWSGDITDISMATVAARGLGALAASA